MNYYILQFRARCRSTGSLPFFKGSTIRGAVGKAFHDIVCRNSRGICKHCLVSENCYFFKLFYAEQQKVISAKNVPRPYIFRTDNYKRDFEIGSCINFEIVLFENTIKLLNLLIESVRLATYRGFGASRLRFEILEAKIIGASKSIGIDLNQYENIEIPPAFSIKVPDLHKPNSINAAMFELVSPSYLIKNRLKSSKAICELIKSFIRRTSMISRFWGDNEWSGFHFGRCFEKLKEVKIYSSKVKLLEFSRYSVNQEKKIPVKGYVGYYLAGPIPVFLLEMLPHLENLHVGKGCSRGMGQTKVYGFIG